MDTVFSFSSYGIFRRLQHAFLLGGQDFVHALLNVAVLP